MPVSIQFESIDFSGTELLEDRLQKRLEEKFGPETKAITRECRNMIRRTVTEMRNGLKETCRRVDMEGTAISWAFIRYKHDPADAAMLGGGSNDSAPPKVEPPKPEPKPEPKAEPPKVEVPKVEPPKFEPPKVESPPPKPESPKPKAPPPKSTPSPKPEHKPAPAAASDNDDDDERPSSPPPRKKAAKTSPRETTPRRENRSPYTSPVVSRKPPPKKKGAGLAAAAKDAAAMTVEDVQDWLDDVGLADIARNFQDSRVTGKALLQLKAVANSIPTEAFIGFLKDEFMIRRTGEMLHLMYSLEHDLKDPSQTQTPSN